MNEIMGTQMDIPDKSKGRGRGGMVFYPKPHLPCTQLTILESIMNSRFSGEFCLLGYNAV
jgi:hypothetical protein